MRNLNRELEMMNEKNPPFRTNFDYRDMVKRAIAAEAALAAKTDECERLNLVLNERIADINAVLDDNESHRAMKLATDLAFMEQRKQIERMKCCQNCRLYNDCPGEWEDNVCGNWEMEEEIEND